MKYKPENVVVLVNGKPVGGFEAEYGTWDDLEPKEESTETQDEENN